MSRGVLMHDTVTCRATACSRSHVTCGVPAIAGCQAGSGPVASWMHMLPCNAFLSALRVLCALKCALVCWLACLVCACSVMLVVLESM